MEDRARRRTPPLLIAVLLVGLTGCVGPARGPDPLLGQPTAPPAPPTHTDAKPASPGFLAAFEPHAARVEVQPPDALRPTHTEQVLIATVVDADGRPLPGRRVDWALDGPGAIVAIDERGRLLEMGHKTDNHSAFTFTEHFEHAVHRDGGADFTIGRGQSWCVVSSAEEGQTHVTAAAPDVGAAGVNRVVATQHWADADWTPPAPSAGRPGGQQFLGAAVFRRDSRVPLAGYSVRYRILDGPPAQFMPSQQVEAVVATSGDGAAPVVLAQTGPQSGRNRIGVELLSKSGEVVARGETYADWQGPDLSLSATFLPTAAVGQEAPLTLAVVNGGPVASRPVTVRVTVPDGCKYVRSDPPATPQGKDLVWMLPAPGRDRRLIQAVFLPDQVGPVTARASLITEDGRREEKTAVCQVTPPPAPQLQVWPTGPETGLVGGQVTYQVRVQNQGTGPATNVVLKAALSGGLVYPDGGENVETPVGTLAAGESRTVTLPVLPKQAGQASAKLTAIGDGGLAATAERPLRVRDARLTLRLSAPPHGCIGRPAAWELEVCNVGQAALTQTTVVDSLPPELAFVEATDGGRLQGSQVVWNVGDLPPQGRKVLHLTTTSPLPTLRAANTATATARAAGDPSAADVRAQANTAMDVVGLPAFKLTVEASDGPVEVGGRTAYRIQVKNTGTMPSDRLQLTALIPAQMRVATASGPTAYQVNGGQLTFASLTTLPPGQTATYIVEVDALRPGEARFRAELTTAALREPVVKEESTNVR
ncbi:MAG TPA: CARDB domain-containing protein [Gemmataceae bacterium]|nr:CARDB domain-containing protein [Gemmataceae bacterium]